MKPKTHDELIDLYLSNRLEGKDLEQFNYLKGEEDFAKKLAVHKLTKAILSDEGFMNMMKTLESLKKNHKTQNKWAEELEQQFKKHGDYLYLTKEREEAMVVRSASGTSKQLPVISPTYESDGTGSVEIKLSKNVAVPLLAYITDNQMNEVLPEVTFQKMTQTINTLPLAPGRYYLTIEDESEVFEPFMTSFFVRPDLMPHA